jgi:hypothetical protein
MLGSSLTSWKNNGRKNEWSLDAPDAEDADVLDMLIDNGVSSPGVFNLPICSYETAMANAGDANVGGDWWPCI